MIFARVTSCRSLVAQLALAALGCLSACSGGEAAAPASTPETAGAAGSVGCVNASTDHYEPGLKKSGGDGRYDFALLSSDPAPPSLDDNTFVVQVTSADGAPASGELGVALDMPEHGHPSPKLPDVSYDESSQAFTLEPMRLFMVGLWRITFSFAPSDASNGDSAVFEFCID
jgi:hypothetical protein